MNPYLSIWFTSLSVAGMGLAAWLGNYCFKRLAVPYGAEGLAPPSGMFRTLFRTLIALWIYLIGAMLASLIWRIWPEITILPTVVMIGLGALGLATAVYYLIRGF